MQTCIEFSACRKNACGAEYRQPFHEEYNKRRVTEERLDRTKEAIMNMDHGSVRTRLR
jgi:hypothetical protein